MSSAIRLIVSSLFLALLAACGGGGGTPAAAGNPLDNPQTNPPVANNAYEALQARADTTLVTRAVNIGGVIHQMSGAGDYTFFAPTDTAMAAWAASRSETLDELLADNNEMYRVMKYHIVSRRYSVAGLPFGLPMISTRDEVMKAVASSQAGANVVIFDGKGFGANVDRAESDIVTANATIHIVDRVMMPTESNVGQLLRQKGNLNLFADIFEKSLGTDLLSNEAENFTILAPDDAAINAILASLGTTHQALVDAAPGSVLAARRDGIAAYHLMPGVYNFVEQLPKGTPIATRLFTRTFSIDPTSLQITDATGGVSNFSEADGIAKNGVIHVIDRVLLSVPL
ncbi:MAG: fasciclin domain-containing protein [Burkholderiaceae bacterium]